MLIKQTKDMTERERIAVENSNNQYLEALAYVAVGTIFPYAGNKAPETFMFCNGSLLDKTQYAHLFEIIGYTFGGGGDLFKIPNLTGEDGVNHIIKVNQTIPNLDSLVPSWVKLLLEGGTEWIFDGGNSSGEVDIEFVTEKAADYIVEQGASGVWTYRKWNSGVAECWYKGNVTFPTDGGGAGIEGFFVNSVNITLPFSFIDNPFSVCDTGWNAINWVQCSANTTSVTVRKFANTNGTNATMNDVSIYVKGRWK